MRSARSRRSGFAAAADFYWTLHAVFVNRRDQRELFDQAFHIFWRKPDLLEKMMQLLLPQIEAAERRAARSSRGAWPRRWPREAAGRRARRPTTPSRRGSSSTPR